MQDGMEEGEVVEVLPYFTPARIASTYGQIGKDRRRLDLPPFITVGEEPTVWQGAEGKHQDRPSANRLHGELSFNGMSIYQLNGKSRPGPPSFGELSVQPSKGDSEGRYCTQE